MSWFNFSKPTAGQSRTEAPVKVFSLTSQQVSTDNLSHLAFDQASTPLVLAFVSPHLDMARVLGSLKQAMPFADHVIGIMSAGELSSCGQSLYHNASDHWDNFVLQSFSGDLFSEVAVRTVPLHSGGSSDPTQQINAIQREIQNLSIPFSLNYQDTLALTFFDGLSASEGFFMRALYASNKFPCYFVGGSEIP